MRISTEGSDAIRCIKIKILRGQTYDLALSQCAHQCEVDCQMQDGVLHAVQSRPHFLYRPDGALLRRLLGAVHGNRAFDKDAPLYGILEGSAQQPVHLMDRCAGKETLLLLFGQFLLLSLDIRTAGRFAQDRVEVLHVVGLEFLHLHRVCELSVPNHVHFKLLELLKTQWKNLSGKLGVYFETA